MAEGGVKLKKEEAELISFALCEVFHKKNVDIGWAFKKEPPTFCGLISEVLDYKETDKDVVLKLRMPKLKGSRTPNPLGCCVIIATGGDYEPN